MKFIVIIIIFLCFQSCVWDKTDERCLMIKNNSKETIYTVLSNDNIIKDSYLYSEYENKETYEKFRKENSLLIFRAIQPNEIGETSNRPKSWDTYLETSKEKKISLFIIHKDSIDKYGWFDVFKKNIYNKKYEFTIEDLDKQKWEVVYE